MALANENYLKLKAGYLFPEIGRRVKAFAGAHPSARIIRLIGTNGSRALAKVASLLLAAIAVKMIRSGIIELAGR